MLLIELLKKEIFENSDEIENIINDILLKYRRNNVKNIPTSQLLKDIEGFIDVYIDINDPGVKDQLITSLSNNNWIKDIDPTGMIVLKTEDDLDIDGVGKSSEDERDRQETKVRKIASKNIKDKAKSGGGEL